MKVLRELIIGILISLSCSYIFVTLSVFLNDAAINGPDLIRQILVAVGLGAAIGLLSFIFDIERLPFLFQLALHFIGVSVCVMIAGSIGYWFIHFGFINVLISEICIYLVVWFFVYLLDKKDVDRMNKAIKERKE